MCSRSINNSLYIYILCILYVYTSITRKTLRFGWINCGQENSPVLIRLNILPDVCSRSIYSINTFLYIYTYIYTHTHYILYIIYTTVDNMKRDPRMDTHPTTTQGIGVRRIFKPTSVRSRTSCSNSGSACRHRAARSHCCWQVHQTRTSGQCGWIREMASTHCR